MLPRSILHSRGQLHDGFTRCQVSRESINWSLIEDVDTRFFVDTSSIVIPHGETKYTHRSPADGPSFIDVGSPNTFTPFRRRCATASSSGASLRHGVRDCHQGHSLGPAEA